MAQPVTEADLGDLLAVFAHPDDEAYLAGGLMAHARDLGRRVVCVTATKGELGFPDDDPRSIEERAALREVEMAACMAALGVEEHHWLGLADGSGHQPDDEGVLFALQAIIEDLRPGAVVTFGPDGQTLHPDHIAISRWATLAVRAAGHQARLLYATTTQEWLDRSSAVVSADEFMMVPGADPEVTPIEELALLFRVEGAALDRKVAALRCQASQVDPLVDLIGLDRYAEWVAEEFFREPTAADWPD